MGYNTNFEGKLKIVHTLKDDDYDALVNILEDTPLKISEEDNSKIIWKGTEKTYDLDKTVNNVVKEMQKVYPEFTLKGELLAQGERINDRWYLRMIGNVAHKVDVKGVVFKKDKKIKLGKKYISKTYKILVLKFLMAIYLNAQYDDKLFNQTTDFIKDLEEN